MKNNNQDYSPGQWNFEDSEQSDFTVPKKQGRTCSVGFLLSLLCIVTAITVLLTYTLTSASDKRYYTEQLKAQDQMAWVQRMNNIRNAAEESVLNELIYD